MTTKLDPIAEFRSDHRKVRDFLFDLAGALETGEIARARELLGEINAFVGPHFRYEEEFFYPVMKEFLGEYVDGLVEEHDGAINTALTAASLLSKETVSPQEAAEAAKAARALLVHVSNCDGLNILAERLPQERLDYLAGRYEEARAAAVPLLEWAEKVRKR